MREQVVAMLEPKPGQTVLDATAGSAGHAVAIAKMIFPGGKLIALDADQEAVKRSKDALRDFGGMVVVANENFRDLGNVLAGMNIEHIDAALFDLGVSSCQLDDGSRGFSMRQDSALDMRMDRRLAVTAADLVNRLKEDELSSIIERYGEERFHRKIARRIVEARMGRRIETTAELAAIVRRAVGAGGRRYKIDPATRTFQAIRIAVNDEMVSLEKGLKDAVSMLRPGGRIAVIAFHSIEDRIVKTMFKSYAGLGVIKLITKKPVRPEQDELIDNPRARSARLRVAERI
jgi:16S rRNA (cytosine1402-N4)-methyltransferase